MSFFFPICLDSLRGRWKEEICCTASCFILFLLVNQVDLLISSLLFHLKWGNNFRRFRKGNVIFFFPKERAFHSSGLLRLTNSRIRLKGGNLEIIRFKSWFNAAGKTITFFSTGRVLQCLSIPVYRWHWRWRNGPTSVAFRSPEPGNAEGNRAWVSFTLTHSTLTADGVRVCTSNNLTLPA